MTAMDIKRFTALAEIYGSDLRRWPAGEQAGARALLTRDDAARTLLASTARLDEALDLWTTPPASGRLRERILAAAPPLQRRWLGRAAFWISSAGLATAAVVGMLCGAAVSSAAIANERDDAWVASTTAEGWGPVGSVTEDGAGVAKHSAAPRRTL